ncbi:AAA family ATPase [Undibacterium fentianense]|uniref:ATP-binding protein n=1 Tax=Undibacterium fentianense TaxID=2828728 RepID=A0A941DZV5_9BURK|nr:ATP-binding protein [Undibacterium fentianense]MBR7798682.1 ATP-binding protein [Undibacterium fentianense]
MTTDHATLISKIAILGAESSGKSQLAEALAQAYSTVWIPEYLREFVELKQRVPSENEQLTIAQTQRQNEDRCLVDAHLWLFCDTAPWMTAIYSQHYFKSVPPELSSLANSHASDYAFTIVTAPDFPWESDGLQRESPQIRDIVHGLVIDSLDQSNIPFLLVSGSLKERLEQVQFALDFLA